MHDFKHEHDFEEKIKLLKSLFPHILREEAPKTCGECRFGKVWDSNPELIACQLNPVTVGPESRAMCGPFYICYDMQQWKKDQLKEDFRKARLICQKEGAE